MAAGLDPEYVQELFAAFGTVAVRRMFGGAGVYADGIMFGLIADGVIYLKATPDGVATFEAEGCAPFSYATKDGKRGVMSYWRMPDRLYDDPDELVAWARRALAAAQAAQATKPNKTKLERPGPPASKRRR